MSKAVPALTLALCLTASLPAWAEVTEWTMRCVDTNAVQVFRVVANDRVEARELVMRQVRDTNFCSLTRVSVVKVEAK